MRKLPAIWLLHCFGAVVVSVKTWSSKYNCFKRRLGAAEAVSWVENMSSQCHYHLCRSTQQEFGIQETFWAHKGLLFLKGNVERLKRRMINRKQGLSSAQIGEGVCSPLSRHPHEFGVRYELFAVEITIDNWKLRTLLLNYCLGTYCSLSDRYPWLTWIVFKFTDVIPE